MLIVDDESMNLDLLYRAFRKDFKVLRAESGHEALKVLASEGEVAVIISDQRMPQMKGTEFLSKTVSDFPDTVRMILTGFTDVADLIDAINSGEVYRYVTKPWNTEQLKALVNQAAEKYDSLKQQQEEAKYAEKQSKLIVTVGQLIAQSMVRQDALTFLAGGFGQVLDADVCIVVLNNKSEIGCYGEAAVDTVKDNRLVRAAIATQQPQSATGIQSDTTQSDDALYADETQCHLVYPIICQKDLLAILSLQWKTDYSTLNDVERMVNLISPLLAASIKVATT